MGASTITRREERTALASRSFVVRGNRVGVLLIHGFAGSIADLRYFGERLHAMNGYTVVGVRLAGHGLTTHDLDRSICEDWIASARSGLTALLAVTDEVAIVGESMGALIALRLSREHPAIRCVVCMSPAFSLPNERARSVVTRVSLPYVRWKKSWVDDARAQRGSLREVTTFSYRELTRLLDSERSSLSAVTVPVLALYADNDFIADPHSVEILQSSLPHTQVTVETIHESVHHLNESVDADGIARQLSDFIERHAHDGRR
ncbi:MAG: alpha/beta fold hydrolase [Candidatus Kerfeldbacteria bacterium]